MRRGRPERRVRDAGPRLFSPEELCLRPTGLARLRALTRRPSPPPSGRERRRVEDRETMERLRSWCVELAREFGLRVHALEPEREGVNEHYGICYSDGLIRIRLRHATTGRLLKESSLVDTLCHELAHLRHMNHGLRFRRLYERILRRARKSGYYRPGPQGNGRPRQTLLFDDDSCGTARD